MDQSSHDRNTKSKPYLRLVTGNKPGLRPDVRLGGRKPADDMEPGEYVADCDWAWLASVDPKTQCRGVTVQYLIAEGPHRGTAVRQWIDRAIDAGDIVSPYGKYAAQCCIALGRELQNGDPIKDPGEIFAGKRFVVFVGYRKSELANGRGKRSHDLALACKDDKDYLRVHEILERQF